MSLVSSATAAPASLTPSVLPQSAAPQNLEQYVAQANTPIPELEIPKNSGDKIPVDLFVFDNIIDLIARQRDEPFNNFLLAISAQADSLSTFTDSLLQGKRLKKLLGENAFPWEDLSFWYSLQKYVEEKPENDLITQSKLEELEQQISNALVENLDLLVEFRSFLGEKFITPIDDNDEEAKNLGRRLSRSSISQSIHVIKAFKVSRSLTVVKDLLKHLLESDLSSLSLLQQVATIQQIFVLMKEADGIGVFNEDLLNIPTIKAYHLIRPKIRDIRDALEHPEDTLFFGTDSQEFVQEMQGLIKILPDILELWSLRLQKIQRVLNRDDIPLKSIKALLVNRTSSSAESSQSSSGFSDKMEALQERFAPLFTFADRLYDRRALKSVDLRIRHLEEELNKKKDAKNKDQTLITQFQEELNRLQSTPPIPIIKSSELQLEESFSFLQSFLLENDVPFIREELSNRLENDKLFRLRLIRALSQCWSSIKISSSIDKTAYAFLLNKIRETRNLLVHNPWRMGQQQSLINSCLVIAKTLPSLMILQEQASAADEESEQLADQAPNPDLEHIAKKLGVLPLLKQLENRNPIKSRRPVVVDEKLKNITNQIEKLGRTENEGELLQILERALEEGLNPNARDDKQRTMLHFVTLKVSEENSHEAASLLIKNGANPALIDHKGKSCLHYAAEAGNLRLAEFFIEWGAALHKDTSGKTPFDVAIDRDQYDFAEWIEPFCSEPRNAGSEKLIKAVRKLDLQAVQNSLGQIPMQLPFEGNMPLLELLQKEVTEIEQIRVIRDIALELINHSPWTVNIRQKTDGRSVLHVSAEYSLIRYTSEEIQEESTQVDREIREAIFAHARFLSPWDKSGETPLHLACSTGNEDWVNQFMDHRTDENSFPLDQQDSSQITPLGHALQSNQSSNTIITALLENGANPNQAFATYGENQRERFLPFAVDHKSLEIVEIFLHYGANPFSVLFSEDLGRDLTKFEYSFEQEQQELYRQKILAVVEKAREDLTRFSEDPDQDKLQKLTDLVDRVEQWVNKQPDAS